MLFQHQSLPDELERHEPSWLLGNHPGPYINQVSRNLFMSLGHDTAFLGLDCRTERTRDSILSQETYDLVFDRCRRELVEGQTKHLIVLLGVPIAYPRLVWLENVLTSKMMDPIKALARFGVLGNLMNKFDGGVEILDDLDDHWTAKHHKHERNWFIQELQELAREKSVRITILGGDVHLAAAGEFKSNPKLGIPKDQDHRYMPNVISSAIVNAPPSDNVADVLNKRNKVHHLDQDTDENMIPLFLVDVDGRRRNNKHLFPRRNWCSITRYDTSSSPEEYAHDMDSEDGRDPRSFSMNRNGSWSRNGSMTRSRSITRRDPQRGNLLTRAGSQQRAPPSSYHPQGAAVEHEQGPNVYGQDPHQSLAASIDTEGSGATVGNTMTHDSRGRSTSLRRPNGLTRKASRKDKTGRDGMIEMEGSLEIGFHCEVDQKNPAGITRQYTLLVPALHRQSELDDEDGGVTNGVRGFIGRFRSRSRHGYANREPYHDAGEYEEYDQHNAESQHLNDRQDNLPYNDDSIAAQPQPEHQNISHQHHLASAAAQLQEQHHQHKPYPYDADNVQTTASHQRASQDSNSRPTEQVLNRLPRSSAPLEDETAFHRRRGSSSASRPGSRGRSADGAWGSGRGRGAGEAVPPMPAMPPMQAQQNYSGTVAQSQSGLTTASRGRSSTTVGPPPPANIDRLPPSVQKRYRQYNQPSTDPIDYTSTSNSAQVQAQRSPPPVHNPTNTYAPPSSFQQYDTSAVTKSRRYSAGSMESPLLPIAQTFLRSSDKRTNIDEAVLLEQQGIAPQQQRQQHVMAMEQDRRAVSGPASYAAQAQQQQQPQGYAQAQTQMQAGRDPYAQYTASPVLSPGLQTAVPQRQGGEGKLARHFDIAGPQDVSSGSGGGGGGSYDPHYMPATANRNTSGSHNAITSPYANRQRMMHDNDDDDDNDAISTTSSTEEPARPVNAPLPSAIRNKGSSSNKIARHFDDMPAAQSHPPSSSAAAKAPGGFKGLIRRLSGSGREGDRNKPGLWKTEAELAAERRREREVESMGMQNKLQRKQQAVPQIQAQQQAQGQGQSQAQGQAQGHGQGQTQTRSGWIDGVGAGPATDTGTGYGSASAGAAPVQAQGPISAGGTSAGPGMAVGDAERERMRAREEKERDEIDDGYADDGAVGRSAGGCGGSGNRRRSWKVWK